MALWGKKVWGAGIIQAGRGEGFSVVLRRYRSGGRSVSETGEKLGELSLGIKNNGCREG